MPLWKKVFAGAVGLFMAVWFALAGHSLWWWLAWTPDAAGTPCPTIPRDQAIREQMLFSRATASSRNPVDSILVQPLAGQVGPDCRQVLGRLGCTFTGPRTLYVQVDGAMAIVTVPAGHDAELKVEAGTIRCGMVPTAGAETV